LKFSPEHRSVVEKFNKEILENCSRISNSLKPKLNTIASNLNRWVEKAQKFQSQTNTITEDWFVDLIIMNSFFKEDATWGDKYIELKESSPEERKMIFLYYCHRIYDFIAAFYPFDQESEPKNIEPQSDDQEEESDEEQSEEEDDEQEDEDDGEQDLTVETATYCCKENLTKECEHLN
jgi:hypothetical protein